LEGLSQEIFYKKAGGALRQIRKSYRKNYFYRNINCDWSDPLKYLPPDFPPEQWPVLVNQWSDRHYVVSFDLLNNSSIFTYYFIYFNVHNNEKIIKYC